MIDHVGFEVSDLTRSAAFYDPVFFALGARRMVESEHAIAYGVNGPEFWIVVRGRAPAPGYGHVALKASGSLVAKAASHHSSRVTLTLHVTDAGNLTTKVTSKVKPRS